MEWLVCFLIRNAAVIALILGAGFLGLVLVGVIIAPATAQNKEEIRRIGYDARRTIDETSDDYLKRVRRQTRR